MDADPPQVVKADANADSVVVLAFSSDTLSMLELTDYAERNLVDRLSTVPGVATVGIIGGRRYSMRIWLDRQSLAAHNLAVSDIEDALRRENVELPAGRLESRTREFSLRTMVGLDNEEDFRNLVIVRGADGHLVRLGEVADVRLAAENDRSYSRLNGKPGLMLTVQAQSKGNTLDIARGVRQEVERLRPTLPPDTVLDVSIDNALPIEAALREVLVAVAFALVSVLTVIYLFLGNLRATLIPAVTIPVSIVASLTVMYALGYTINVLTLLGLVLAIGLVVDDAIVVLENVHRRTELGEPSLVAAIRGTHEIGFAVIATTLTLVSVFVPISFLPGDIGRLFREFGFTLAAAVVFSAFVALTLTPMLASRLPDHARPNRFAARRRPVLQGAFGFLRQNAARRDAPPLGGGDRRARAGGARCRDVSNCTVRVHAAGGCRPRFDFARGPRGLEHGIHGSLRATTRADRDGRHGEGRNRPRADTRSRTGRLGSAHG